MKTSISVVSAGGFRSKPCYTGASINYAWLSGCVRCDGNSTKVKLQKNTDKRFSYQDAKNLCDSRVMTSSCLELLETKAYKPFINDSKSKFLWTGVRRHNETHFTFGNGLFKVQEHQLCEGYSAVYPFMSSVVMSRVPVWYVLVNFYISSDFLVV